MLKSLSAGVSGLQSHQVAMDVVSNNIANVNTIGFKYSRANFSDLLSETKSIATAPQGKLGGKNSIQVGLGVQINSTTKIFSQGSVKNTDKNTDVAIQGDGFYIVSPDNGTTYKYTRDGDFKFDANGNFVNNSGLIVQGWTRDAATGKVDSTAPITDLKISPGLTTPAQASSTVVLKANLNSGPVVKSYSAAYEVPSGPAPALPTLPALDKNGNPVASGNLGVMFNGAGEAFSLQKGQGVWVAFQSSTKTDGGAVAAGAAELNVTFTLDDGSTKQITTTGGLASNTSQQNAARYVSAINAQVSITGITATYDAVTNKINLINTNSASGASHNIRLTAVAGGSGLTTTLTKGLEETAYRYRYDPTGAAAVVGADKTFTTLADLREALENQAQDGNADGVKGSVTIKVNASGKFEISNPGGSDQDQDLNLQVTSIVEPGTTENTRFTQNMTALNAVLPVASGGKAFSQSFNAATSSSSIDIFDSLGSKHTLRMEFRKVALDINTGSTWDMVVTAPEPATIDTVAPTNEKVGSVKFNNDGSLATYNPPNLSFSGNNGSAPDQQINLSFGAPNSFDGMTSFDSKSTTSGISQDGFTGGDLVGIRIDQSGTLIGSFSNGHSFGLAQIAMAKFTNNEGLSGEGGNVFGQTANSGDPIIGTAATAGRGFIQSSSLESSNVDLSSALTQLIIIQRGFQANAKTITTSDQLLQTLIQLKR